MKYFSALLALIVLSACTSTPSQSGDYVGMTVTEAESKAATEDVLFRVVMRDGVPLPATMDYRPGRINATVEGDIVTSYDVEGEGSSDSSDTSVDTSGSTYVGLTVMQAEAQAVASGVPFRVVMRDGEQLPVTKDYRIGRINATVEGDIVTSYDIEGNE
jgi:hypothetical protein